jgi:uncharacterized membrane protein
MGEKQWGTTNTVLLIVGIALIVIGLLFRPSGLGGAFCGGFISAITSGCMDLDRIGDYGYTPAAVLSVAGLVVTIISLVRRRP